MTVGSGICKFPNSVLCLISNTALYILSEDQTIIPTCHWTLDGTGKIDKWITKNYQFWTFFSLGLKVFNINLLRNIEIILIRFQKHCFWQIMHFRYFSTFQTHYRSTTIRRYRLGTDCMVRYDMKVSHINICSVLDRNSFVEISLEGDHQKPV